MFQTSPGIPLSRQTMNKAELIAHIAGEAGPTKKQAAAALGAFLAAIEDTVAAGGSVTVTGFGTFKLHLRRPRKDCPRIGEPRKTAAKPRPVFKPGKAFLEKVGK